MNAVVATLANKLDAELNQAFQGLAAVLDLRIDFSNGADLSKAAAIVCIGSFPKQLPVPQKQVVLSSCAQLSDLPAGAELQIAARAATPAAKPAAHRVRTSPTVTMRRVASEMRDRLKI